MDCSCFCSDAPWLSAMREGQAAARKTTLVTGKFMFHGALRVAVVPGAARVASHPAPRGKTRAGGPWGYGSVQHCLAGCWRHHHPLWVTRVGKEVGGTIPLSPAHPPPTPRPSACRPAFPERRGCLATSLPRQCTAGPATPAAPMFLEGNKLGFSCGLL